MLLPLACASCGRVGAAVCPRCVAALEPPPDLPAPAGVDSAVALCAYSGAGRALVGGLKYRNRRAAAVPVGRAVARLVRGAGVGAVDLVTWAPTSPARRRDRGYDQSRLLARAVAGELGVPHLGVLARSAGAAQTGRPRAERVTGVSFVVTRRPPATVLVVDDVRTTGATLSAAARALRSAGAVRVHVATLAATP